MARKKKQEGGGGLPGWMATYGDMVTLLLCFFVLLYSFSTLDTVKFKALASSLQQAFSVQPGGSTPSTLPGIQFGNLQDNMGSVSQPSEGNEQYIARYMKTIVKDLNIEDNTTVTTTERGVVISLTEQLLFSDGSAVLQPEATRVLYKIGAALRDIPNTVAVEGHTDNVPLNGSIYKNNWGLSAARAASVTDYLETKLNISAPRLEAVGYAASRPIVPNDTEEHRRLNRRIDLVILSMHAVK